MAIDIITAMMVMLFMYTGISKLITRETFLLQIKSSPYLSSYAQWASWIIPLSELLIAAALLFKRTRLAGYYAFTFLMALFTIYIIVILLSGKALPCSCGGVISAMTWTQHLVFNSIFILLGVAVIKLYKRFRWLQ